MSKFSLCIVFLISLAVASALQDFRNRPATAKPRPKGPLSSALGHASDGKKHKNEEIKSEKLISQFPTLRRKNRPDLRTGRPMKTPTPSPSTALPRGMGTSVGRNDFKILNYEQEQDLDGYRYAYQTENGISAEKEGHIEELSTGEGMRSKGFYEYTGDDGALYRVDYVADDAGFVPQGAHIPPTPLHVVKLLQYLALNAAKE